MTLIEIANLIQRGLDVADFSDTLTFDCGADGVIAIAEGRATNVPQNSDCTIRISRENLAKLVKGKLNPMTGVMMGKLKVSGDASVALKLGQLLKN